MGISISPGSEIWLDMAQFRAEEKPNGEKVFCYVSVTCDQHSEIKLNAFCRKLFDVEDIQRHDNPELLEEKEHETD